MTDAQPRIGVTRWEDVPGERIEDYWERIGEAGGEALDLRGSDIEIGALDGLVLTGGLDIAPDRYGATAHERTKQAEPERDEYELRLLRAALAAGLPVLAICRGHQLLNVAMGGGLLQHIEDGSHRADYKTEGYPSRWHAVRLAPESRLRALFGADELDVNSRHHQAVLPATLAPGLDAVATASDGVVEATESRSHRWVVGVQWHPERLEQEHPAFAPAQRALFRAFAGAAARRPEEVR